ncbi:hypothetical protein CT676_43020 [Bradyrhizobium sp. MOS001]|uniref:hypothetical protein n=1 Tax=Bradyrhizobium sp. MOS001 TaxID=2133948 RepID=UPI001074EA6E|nr:hypothetical protein [Bradyrhizobium sp. MOS001]TFW51808.1 hypothetical protein CT676_43020 [Bradyrhizobium sp. MOS001]
MRKLIAVIGLSILSSGFTTADKERAHSIAITARDAYWDCLAQEIVKVVKTAIPAQDFKLMLEGSCPDQKRDFRTKMSDYLAMMHPDISAQTHISQADYAISAAQADAVTGLIKIRSGVR